MKRSFSLKWIFIGIAVGAALLDATGYPSQRASGNGVPALVVLSLVYGLIRIACRDTNRGFWIGYTLTGWLWLILAHLHPWQLFANGVLPLAEWFEYVRRTVKFEPLVLKDSPLGRAEVMIMVAAAIGAGFATQLTLKKKHSTDEGPTE